MRKKFSKWAKKMAKRAAKRDKLGLFEKAKIKRTAKRDGKNSTPSLNEDNVLSCAFIQKEREALGESLKELETINVSMFKEHYITCDNLISSIPMTKLALEKLKEETPAPLGNDGERRRKAGEEKLSETQVARRRSKEYASKTASFYVNLSSTSSRLNSDINTLRNESNYLKNLETECITVGEKIFCHHMARVEYYWRQVHPIRARIDESFPTSVPINTMALFRTKLEDYVNELREKRDLRSEAVEKVLKEVA